VKNIILIFGLYAVAGSSFICAQNEGGFSFCKFTGETISLVNLEKCPVLDSRNKKLELKSFKVSVFVKKMRILKPLQKMPTMRFIWISL